MTIRFDFKNRNIILFGVFFVASFYLFSQPDFQLVSDRDVISGYQGWAGDPDSITIYIDSTFTAAEKDSLRIAINRWNAAFCVPKLKEVSSKPANITVIGSSTLPDSIPGECITNIDASGDNESAIIKISDITLPLSLKEVCTHEIGHALGLADTDGDANPSDVMKGSGPGNGTDGGLSAHDSIELAAAIAAAIIDIETETAVNPPMAIEPGQFAFIDYDLGTVFPPDVIAQTAISVTPIGDPYLFIEVAFIEENLLKVGINSEPNHASGTIYLAIDLLFPDPYPAMHFRGIHYIHISPAEPVTFECPFSFSQNDGIVHIDWVEECTYPLEYRLRSELVVDGTTHYNQRGGGNYTLVLEPGEHLVELVVDDYQINHAYYSQTILVTGVPEYEEQITNYTVYPNPFTDGCKIEYPDGSRVNIYDISGNLVSHLQEGTKQWKPSPDLPFGIYFIQFCDKNKTKTRKVIYGK